MNVAQTIVSGNSDVTNKTSRQDRDSSSKRGGSGFSDTLGSIDKQSSSTSNASSAPAKPSSASSAATSTTTATAADGAQTQTPAQTAPVAGAPPAPAPAVGTKGIVANTLFLTVGADQTGIAALGDVTLTQGMDMGKVQDTIAPLINADADVAVLPEMSDLAKLVTALSKSIAAPASGETEVVADGSEEAGDADAAPGDVAGESMDLLSLLAATAMPVNQNTPPASQDAGPALSGLSGAGQGADPLADAAVATSTVVRLQKQDVPAIDFHIETQEDGSATLDVSKAMGDVADVVQVVDSRRFVGMAAASNATAISSAMAADPEWATTMAGQTSNSPMISSTGQVVHVLKIQMTPVELGHVTAAMKLVGDELSVQLTAHTLKGYSELQKDSSEILDALKSQGFNVDQVTVTLASGADRQDSSTGNRQPQDAGQQGAQQGQRGSDDRPQEQFYRQPGRGAREETTIHETTSQPEIPSRVTSARPDHVYL
ncbi:flagellar hook-length control protein FliK [Agrobacterium sp. lyk4-40-TYG-31]|uniref:flagellar hook-length control protein FliK n=1 Tax=Agrobacterium sp. lyk4-40-TYG-31 TaxID=3040276 RepID=UPI00254D4DB7|nr:flagellar hook-length control protein FliK [Agrobacterium sp. lyk4-40-TYG-31]